MGDEKKVTPDIGNKIVITGRRKINKIVNNIHEKLVGES